MTLQQKKYKRGGSCYEYANIADNYNLLENAIQKNMATQDKISVGGRRNKKGGCSASYGDVKSTSHMLLDTPIKGGARKNKKGGCSASYGDIKSTSHMLLDTPIKGGNIIGQTLDIFKTGSDIIKSSGGCACGSRTGKTLKKGGAVELAPFAAAVSLLAARYLLDVDYDKKSNTSSKARSVKTSIKREK